VDGLAGGPAGGFPDLFPAGGVPCSALEKVVRGCLSFRPGRNNVKKVIRC
jgi:hypothetical protein